MKVIIMAWIFLYSIPFIYADEAFDQLEKRVQLLESQQEDLLIAAYELPPQVNAFLKSNLTFGGFFEPSFQVIQGKDTPFQALTPSSFLGLNTSADFSSKIKFVSQVLTGYNFPLQNPHDDPRAQNFGLPKKREFGALTYGVLLTQAYINYAINDHLHLEGGQSYVPFGIAPQQREIVLFLRRGGPQFINSTEIFTPVWSGFHLYQNFDWHKKRWGYNAYTFTRVDEPKIPGIGTRVWINSEEKKLSTGLSLQGAKYRGPIEETIGYDFKYALPRFFVTTEYAIRLRQSGKPWSFYLEPCYSFYDEELLLYTFIDYYKDPINTTGIGSNVILDPIEKYQYGMGLNWLPTSFTRFRIGLTYNDYIGTQAHILGQNRDYYSLDLSAGVAF